MRTHTGAPRRLAGADALRAIAAIAVVVVHTDHWPLQDSGADQLTWSNLDQSMRFCVPAFVLLSGLLLGIRGAPPRPGPFLRRRLRRTLLPFAVWTPVYLAIGLWLTGDIEPGGIRSWLGGGAGHLYFLLLIPQLYVAYLLWPRRLTPTLRLAVAAMALQLALGGLRLAAPMPGPLGWLALWRGYELFPFWIGYFAAGVAAGRLLADHRGRDDHPRAALACLLALPAALVLLLLSPVTDLRHGDFAQGTGAFLRPSLVPVAITLAGAVVLGTPAALRRLPRLWPPLRTLSTHSLGIYITHPLFAYLLGHRVLSSLLQRDLPGSVAGFLLLTGGTLAAGLVASVLLGASPLAPVIGAERTPLRWPRSAADHDEGHQLLGGGERAVVAHHSRLSGVD